jgi:DNA-binding transcriptional LysR family regulator
MNFSDVYAFKKVAQSLSFTKAARQIGSSRSAISKRISRLEQDLGVVLLNRSTRSVNLTEAGRTFHQYTSEVDTTIERAAEIIRGADLEPCGTVAFTVPSSLGNALLPTLITHFQTTWPDLKFSINFDDDFADLISSSFDVAIRIAQKLTDSSLISRRLGSTRRVLAASPGYLKKHGTPATIHELSAHRCLGLGNALSSGASWHFEQDGRRTEFNCKYAISANSYAPLIRVACLDSGILYVPEICIHRELVNQQLQVILPDVSDPEPYGIFAVYPHRNAAAKVKVLVNFIERELTSFGSLDSWTGPVGPGTELDMPAKAATKRAHRVGKYLDS